MLTRFQTCNDSYHIEFFKISSCEPQIVMLDVKNQEFFIHGVPTKSKDWTHLQAL
jgi:hypothetical protein